VQPWNRTFAGLEQLEIDSAVLRRENSRRSVDAPCVYTPRATTTNAIDGTRRPGEAST
jgi:hypothetical protein